MSSMSNSSKSKADIKFSILSPRPKPSLLTSLSRAITPTTFGPTYTLAKQGKPCRIIDHLPQNDTKTETYKHGNHQGNASQNVSITNDGVHDSHMECEEYEEKAEVQEVFNKLTVSKKHRPSEIENNKTKTKRISNSIVDSDKLLLSLERQIFVITDPQMDTSSRIPDYSNDDVTITTTSTSPRDVWTRSKVSQDRPITNAYEIPTWNHLSGSYSHSSSMSGNSGTLSSPRCSVCDGCSSTSSSYQPLNIHMSSANLRQSFDSGDRSRTCSGQSSSSIDLNEMCTSRSHGEPSDLMAAPTCSMDMVDSCIYDPSVTLTPHQHSVTQQHPIPTTGRQDDHRQHESVCRQNTLGNIVVLSMWVQLSKYRELQTETIRQRKTLSDYERKLDSLILTVLVLSKQMKTALYRLENVHDQLDQLKDKQKQHERKLRRVYIGVGCLVCLYVLQTSSIRKHCLSLIQYFGLFEMFEKVNRTRKVVSENWRNIPSLLTDFWRIFIFRSRSRLRDRFS